MAGIVCIRGRCGSGKDTVIAALKQRLPEIEIVHRTVTRPIRAQGEEQLTPAEFDHRRHAGQFVGVERYNNQWYGLDRAKISGALLNGNTVVVLGGNAGIGLQSEFPETIFIYLTAPITELRRRMLARGELSAEVEQRLAYELDDWEQPQPFDIVVTNLDGQLDHCLGQLVAIIQNEPPRK